MSQTNVSVELPKPDTNESKRPDNESSEGATLVPPAETESVPVRGFYAALWDVLMSFAPVRAALKLLFISTMTGPNLCKGALKKLMNIFVVRFRPPSLGT
jgi:hypothetical protein